MTRSLREFRHLETLIDMEARQTLRLRELVYIRHAIRPITNRGTIRDYIAEIRALRYAIEVCS